MKNLSTLPCDLLVEIAKRLKKHEHFTCFRCVSSSLHLSVEEGDFKGIRFQKKLPYLMLPADGSSGDDNEDTRRQFYSLVEGESIIGSLEIPLIKTSTKMCFESLGWLLTLEVDGSTSLLDPFSNTEIPLPHVHTFTGGRKQFGNADKRTVISKMVLSSRPNETSDFIMMIIIGDCYHLAYWRLGDKAWNKIGDNERTFRDIVYVGDGQFYAIRAMGVIRVINIAAGNVEFHTIIENIPVLHVQYTQGVYILKASNGSVLGIKRIRDNKFYLACEFQVYDIDIETGTWKEVHSLGSMAIFIGRNSSIAVDTTGSNEGVIKANHIYYTDDFPAYQFCYFSKLDWRYCTKGSPYIKGGSVDSGVYNFETKSIEPIYPVEPLLRNVCPAMWITPN